MLDTFSIYEELSVSLGDAPARAITKTLAKMHDDLANTVTKTEFNELKSIVAELAEAQKRTEVKMEELAEAQRKTEERVNELAEAQKRTEVKMEELAEAQRKTEERLDALTKRMDELAEAQKKTEERLNELAEAQRKTEERVNELAEAQRKTEETLTKLIKRVDNIEVQLGGLSMAVGYGIEDKLYPHIDRFVKKVFAVEPENTILRQNIEYDVDKFDEINLYTEGIKDGEEVLVIGECKAQPGKKDIDRFIKMCQRVEKFTGKKVLKYMVGYTFMPPVERYLAYQYPELKYFKTYEIEHGKY